MIVPLSVLVLVFDPAICRLMPHHGTNTASGQMISVVVMSLVLIFVVFLSGPILGSIKKLLKIESL